MSEGRGRRIALWVGVPLLIVGIAVALPGAYESCRYSEEWGLDYHNGRQPVTLFRMKFDRWRDALVEEDAWSVSTGYREYLRRGEAGGEVHEAHWGTDGTVTGQEVYSERGASYYKEPPWQFGIEDRVRDAPWLGIGYEEWRKSVRFVESDSPR